MDVTRLIFVSFAPHLRFSFLHARTHARTFWIGFCAPLRSAHARTHAHVSFCTRARAAHFGLHAALRAPRRTHAHGSFVYCAVGWFARRGDSLSLRFVRSVGSCAFAWFARTRVGWFAARTRTRGLVFTCTCAFAGWLVLRCARTAFCVRTRSFVWFVGCVLPFLRTFRGWVTFVGSLRSLHARTLPPHGYGLRTFALPARTSFLFTARSFAFHHTTFTFLGSVPLMFRSAHHRFLGLRVTLVGWLRLHCCCAHLHAVVFAVFTRTPHARTHACTAFS